VVGQDLLYQRQPDSLAVFLRAEKRREELRPRLWRDARPGVFHLEYAGTVPPPGTNRQGAVGANRFEAVLCDVDERLLELRAIHRHAPEVRRDVFDELYPPALGFSAEQPDEIRRDKGYLDAVDEIWQELKQHVG